MENLIVTLWYILFLVSAVMAVRMIFSIPRNDAANKYKRKAVEKKLAEQTIRR